MIRRTFLNLKKVSGLLHQELIQKNVIDVLYHSSTIQTYTVWL